MSEPHRILTLGDVLTAQELAAQPYPADTVLNDPQQFMPWWLGARFMQMGDDERHRYVLAAVGNATLYGMSLPYAMLYVLMYDSAPAPPCSPFHELTNGASKARPATLDLS